MEKFLHLIEAHLLIEQVGTFIVGVLIGNINALDLQAPLWSLRMESVEPKGAQCSLGLTGNVSYQEPH
jgi:hypothetical protein